MFSQHDVVRMRGRCYMEQAARVRPPVHRVGEGLTGFCLIVKAHHYLCAAGCPLAAVCTEIVHGTAH